MISTLASIRCVAAVWRSMWGVTRRARPARAARAAVLLAPIIKEGQLAGIFASDAKAEWSSPETARLLSELAALLAYAIDMDREGLSKRRLSREPSSVSGGPEVVRKQALLEKLVAERWVVARVAKSIGVTRRTVYMQMRRFGIKRPER